MQADYTCVPPLALWMSPWELVRVFVLGIGIALMFVLEFCLQPVFVFFGVLRMCSMVINA
jgi:hypothetical protein